MTAESERQILLLMLLAQVCSLHDPTPRTFTVHVLSLFERGILDRDSIRFLFDLGLVPTAVAASLESVSGRQLLPPTPPSKTSISRANLDTSDTGAIVPFSVRNKSCSTMHSVAAAAAGRLLSHRNNFNNEANLLQTNTFQPKTEYDEKITTEHPKHEKPPSEILSSERDDTRQLIRAARDDVRRAQEASAIRMHLQHQESESYGFAPSITTGTPSTHPNAATSTSASNVTAGPSTSFSWSVEHHPLSLSRYKREFDQTKLLASGSFGSVYRATNRLDGRDYAIKRVIFSAEGYRNDAVQMVVREVRCLAQCDHPNVVRYYTSWLEPSWMTGGGEEINVPDDLADRHTQQKMLKDLRRLVYQGASSAGARGTFHAKSSETPKAGHAEPPSTYSGYGLTFDRSPGEPSGTSNWDDLPSHPKSLDDSITTGGYGDSGFSDDNDSDCSEWTADISSDNWGQRDFSSRPSRTGTTTIDHGRQEQQQQRRRSNVGLTSTAAYQYQICLFIQMQLCHPTNLADWIRHRNGNNRTLSWDKQHYHQSADIFRQVASGLAHVHSRGIIHRDLKPANVFASDGGSFKIGDFGLSKLLLDTNHVSQHHRTSSTDLIVLPVPDPHQWAGTNHTAGIGTASYAAPEQIDTEVYGPEADIFSLGLILLELFEQFQSEHERAVAFRDCRAGRLPSGLIQNHNSVANLVLWCTRHCPRDRPTAKEVLAKAESLVNIEPFVVVDDEVKRLREELNKRNAEMERYKALLSEKDRTIDELQRKQSSLSLALRNQESVHCEDEEDVSKVAASQTLELKNGVHQISAIPGDDGEEEEDDY